MILEIEPNKFDEQVFQTDTGFDESQYNEWLRTATHNLQCIYDGMEYDNYMLGDVINMLSNTKIKLKK